MLKTTNTASNGRRDHVLDRAILVFGRYGFKKTTIDDLAKAADMSKQGLYLYFASKEEIFREAVQKHMDDGLNSVMEELIRPNASLFERLVGAMDAWFGRLISTFSPGSLDIVPAAFELAGSSIEERVNAVKGALAEAMKTSEEFNRLNNVCTPDEIAQVLYQFGLTWTEAGGSRSDFMRNVALCVRACCQINDELGREK